MSTSLELNKESCYLILYITIQLGEVIKNSFKTKFVATKLRWEDGRGLLFSCRNHLMEAITIFEFGLLVFF